LQKRQVAYIEGRVRHRSGYPCEEDNTRKITVVNMFPLDGVMEAPGGPDEDTSGDVVDGRG
jgi:hypothetical protein